MPLLIAFNLFVFVRVGLWLFNPSGQIPAIPALEFDGEAAKQLPDGSGPELPPESD